MKILKVLGQTADKAPFKEFVCPTKANILNILNLNFKMFILRALSKQEPLGLIMLSQMGKLSRALSDGRQMVRESLCLQFAPEFLEHIFQISFSDFYSCSVCESVST